MSIGLIEPSVSTREANKEKRRRNILDAARKLLTNKGYEALNSRDLAKSAGVTTPTLYNLIGNKEDVLLTLSFESIGQLERTLGQIENHDALQFIEGMVIESTKLIEADEAFFRGSMLAMYQLSAQDKPDTPEQRHARRCTEVTIGGCQKAREQKLLLGNVSVEALGTQMYAVFSAPWREWTYRRLSLEEFRHQVLQGFYMCLCSDATPEFLAKLRKKLRALGMKNATPSRRKRSPKGGRKRNARVASATVSKSVAH